ncbi:MAG: A/G-specific adenine glycosylase [Bacteroidetes bacterium]|nr:A/G-specific adenine glycosylase [Bacteroidota bacterium]
MARPLIEWFLGCQRKHLPWRKTKDPYRIWISELMLQQTRVEQAIPYYRRFLKAFPTLPRLAMANQSAVLKVWEGLGYYRRAKYAHEAARIVLKDYRGKLPNNYDDLRALPGFGPYTAAAVMSIAYGKPYAALDGNASRVLSRLFILQEDPTTADAKRRRTEILQGMMRGSDPSTFTQALIELGALLCSPRSPRCSECPIQESCSAFRYLPDPAVLPIRKERKKKPHYNVSAGILERDGRILLKKRPNTGLLANFWEFPGGKQLANRSREETCRIRFKSETGIEIRITDKICVVKHEFTHFRITVHFYTVACQKSPSPKGTARWIRKGSLKRLPFNLVSKAGLEAYERKK